MIQDTDKKRPSWIRIICGLGLIFIGGPIIAIYAFIEGVYKFMELPFRNLWFIDYFWERLLIFFTSGFVFLLYMGIIGLIAIIGFSIIQGKQRLMKHLICPFPTVLTNEIVRDMKIERADDKFFIFDLGFLMRNTLLLVGGIPTVVFAGVFITDLYKPFSSEMVSPPYDGLGVALFIMFLYGLFPPSRRFVFDRMKGTITFPRHLFFPRCTIPFSKVVPEYSVGTLGFAHPRTGIVMSVIGQYDSGWWSFYVLYMDKNRPLPQGTAFDPYREKDYLRRKAEGFPKPIYPSISLVTDAYMGYVYGAEAFKEKLAKMKHGIIHCYTRVAWFCQDNNIKYDNPNDLVLIGIWKKQYVFKLHAPENVEYIVIPDDTILTDCFLCDGYTAEVKQIK